MFYEEVLFLINLSSIDRACLRCQQLTLFAKKPMVGNTFLPSDLQSQNTHDIPYTRSSRETNQPASYNCHCHVDMHVSVTACNGVGTPSAQQLLLPPTTVGVATVRALYPLISFHDTNGHSTTHIWLFLHCGRRYDGYSWRFLFPRMLFPRRATLSLPHWCRGLFNVCHLAR